MYSPNWKHGKFESEPFDGKLKLSKTVVQCQENHKKVLLCIYCLKSSIRKIFHLSQDPIEVGNNVNSSDIRRFYREIRQIRKLLNYCSN